MTVKLDLEEIKDAIVAEFSLKGINIDKNSIQFDYEDYNSKIRGVSAVLQSVHN